MPRPTRLCEIRVTDRDAKIYLYTISQEIPWIVDFLSQRILMCDFLKYSEMVLAAAVFTSNSFAKDF